MEKKPNVIVILNDDMGYSDIGCYGGEVNTPNLDSLAAQGLRLSQFYNTARCCPSRASLLTGLHPHQTGVGLLTKDQVPYGYPGSLNRNCVTIAEALKSAGYSTYMSGKWHVTGNRSTQENWPRQRGFDRFFGTIAGAGNYFNPATLTLDNEKIPNVARDPGFYYTDAISEYAVRFVQEHLSEHAGAGDSRQPFFMYVAYTAPHWPLQAWEEDIAKYRGRFDKGWDVLRQERLEQMVEMGLIDPKWKLTERDPSQPEWKDAENLEWQKRRMEVYAAQIDRMDQGIGKLLKALQDGGQMEDTLILFLSDNGGCAEVLTSGAFMTSNKKGEPVDSCNDPNVMPGSENTFQSYGVAWANLSNTPFRLYKHWIHEGGISTPFIMHWPGRIKERGGIRHTPGQLTDIMATILDVTGAQYPEEYQGNRIAPLEGKSMVPLLDTDRMERKMLFWEHEGNAAVREGKWKLVRKHAKAWELYDMQEDRTETMDLSAGHPDITVRLAAAYEEWAARCGVISWEGIMTGERLAREARKQ
ncbi:MAG TPA: arylsulfatase [Clostridiales bacterium]|nr:arylsulfatase [Clostridiales bacterium]